MKTIRCSPIILVHRDTSARRMTLLPSGQITWSTWERTLSQVSSGVRMLAWTDTRLTSDSRLQYKLTMAPQPLHDIQSIAHHVNLRIGVAHVADYTAVLHSVQLLSGHHIFIPCKRYNSNQSTVRAINPAPSSAKTDPSMDMSSTINTPPRSKIKECIYITLNDLRSW